MNRMFGKRRSRKNHAAVGAAAQRAAGPQRANKPNRRRLGLVLLLCLVASSVVSFLVFKYLIVGGIPRELVGTWQVTQGPLRGATLEFRADGTAAAVMNRRGKKETTNSSVEVKGKTVLLTTKDETTGKEDTVTQTIVTLIDDELVLRDEDQ